jgi:hypothetical protein
MPTIYDPPRIVGGAGFWTAFSPVAAGLTSSSNIRLIDIHTGNVPDLNAASWCVSIKPRLVSSTITGGVCTAASWHLFVQWFDNGFGPLQNVTVAAPYPDPVIGQNPTKWPRANWTKHKWEVRFKTSTLIDDDPFPTYASDDAEFEIRVDGVVIHTQTGIQHNVHPFSSNWQWTALFTPLGDADGCWAIANGDTYATTSGSEGTPTHANLLAYDSFNDGDHVGWTNYRTDTTPTADVGPFDLATNGMNGTAGLSAFDSDPATNGASGTTRFNQGLYQIFQSLAPPPNPNQPPVFPFDNCPPSCGGGTPGTVADPTGPLPPWTAMCDGGGLVDSVADLADGEDWAA